MDFFEAVKQRRSYYGIGSESPISDERIEEIVRQAVKDTPSAFDSRTSRVILAFGEQHNKIWDITMDVLSAKVPPDRFPATQEKLATFAAGHGTILFYEDQDVVASLQDQFPTYRENFPLWSLQSSGMLQFVVWTGLELEGLGASLQHYNPVIDRRVAEAFDIPASWKLWAEMPFGVPTTQPGEKGDVELGNRVKVFS